MSSAWQEWIPGDELQVARLPHEVKVKFGTLFGSLPPLQEIMQKHGPVVVFESVNRLVRQGHIYLQVRDRGAKGFQCRYAMAGFDEMVTIN